MSLAQLFYLDCFVPKIGTRNDGHRSFLIFYIFSL